MKVCYFGTYEADYPRNITFIEGLKRNGVDVLTCNASLKIVKSPLGVPNFLILLANYVKAYFSLFWKMLHLDCDAVIIGYPSHMDVIIFSSFFKMKGIPILFNPLVSLFDTFVYDRKVFRENSKVAKLLYLIDKWSFSLPNKVFIDTAAHRDYLAKTFKIKKEQFSVVPVGTLEVFFNNTPVEKKTFFQVLYCGKYIPLHSVETIVKAALLLKNEKDIKFKLIGTGQDYSKIRTFVKEKGLENIEFVEWMEPEDVSREIRASHVVLGVFKKGGKASRVVPNKVFDALAAGAIVVTEENDAIKEFFSDKKEVILVEPENPDALAEKLKWIKQQYLSLTELGERGRERVQSIASIDKIGKIVKEEIERILREKRNVR